MGKNRGGIFKSKLSGSVDNINDDFCNKINKVFSNRSYLYDNTVVCSRIENRVGASGFSNFELCIEYEKILDHEIYDGPDGVSITMYDDVEAYLKKCHKETFANSIRFVTEDI